VKLLPIDAQVSGWDCACVREGDETVIRLGTRLINQLGEDAGKRVDAAKPFADVEDLAARAQLDRKELVALAESGALDPLAGGRRDAIWKVVAPRPVDLYEGLDIDREKPKLARMSRAEQLVLDYERTGVSIADHPMKLLRPRLGKRIKHSKDLLAMRSGERVSTAGLVICRQRPGTASGVVFVTMEDEHGFSNLVLWARVFEKFQHIATTARLLVAHGKIERSDDPKGFKPPDIGAPQSVVYVIVDRLERADAELPNMASASRDFH
jgi:error-prone DNA polymerase